MWYFDTIPNFLLMKRCEALEIVKLEMARFDKIRDIQWKLNISIWTVIILGISFFYDKKPQGKFYFLIPFLSIIVFVCHHQFVSQVQKTLGITKGVWNSIIKQLNSNDTLDIKVRIKRVTDDFEYNETDELWMWFQLFVTAVLLIVFSIVTCPYI
jgi:hypothetical protein